jgi:purine-binding chemotaxis protein CheW
MTFRPRAPKDLDEKTKEVLARRAERLRLPPQIESAGPTEWVAELTVGEDRYAIALSTLRAVVPLRRVTPVPLARPHVVGILRFQGQIITALSMSSLLGVRGWRRDPSVLLVVDPGWGRLVAIDCEEVPRPIALPAGALRDARAREGTAIAELTHEGSIIHAIDLGKLLDRRTGGRSG